ncbi:MAG TPA: S53 family peptidase [Polyangia bacterium]|jgi:kumamolisin
MRRSYWIFAVAALVTGCSNRLPSNVGPSDRVASAIDLGSAPLDEQLDFVIGLQARNQPALHEFLQNQKFSQDVLSAEDFAELYSVSGAEYARFATWLQSQGVTVLRTVAGRNTITGTATVAVIQQAFGVTLHQYQDPDGKFIATVDYLTLSPDVAGSVSGVVGLSGDRPWLPHIIKMPPQPEAGVTTYTAAKLETQYNSTAITTAGMGETVVILGAGNQPKMTDVTAYLTAENPYTAGLTTLGAYTQEQIGGPNRDDDQTAEGERQENTLDIEMLSALSPYATIYQDMVASNGVGLFSDGISYIVNKHATAHAVTVSYGSCERGAAGEMPVMNSMFMQAKAEGQQWFFAAGDSGTDGCRDGTGNKIVSAGWPASSPYVVGVGGTGVKTGTTEVVWDWGDAFQGATGGGASESFDKPAYQTGVGPNASDGARDEPDVAALAGAPGVVVYLDGSATSFGGTSAATPMWAGVWAMIEQGKGHKTITNGIETLYTLGAAGHGFHDITSGSNGAPNDNATGGYAAGTGYDLATGWGSPNTADLIMYWP